MISNLSDAKVALSEQAATIEGLRLRIATLEQALRGLADSDIERDIWIMSAVTINEERRKRFEGHAAHIAKLREVGEMVKAPTAQ